MKNTMYWLIGIVVVLALLTLGVKLMPKGQAKIGLVAGQLSPCPNTPNCVCSEGESPSAYVAPFAFKGEAASAWLRVKQAIVANGGRIQTQEPTYLTASFITKWLGFVDDVELRLDADNGVIHVRSASRLGRSDFGINRARVERLRLLFNSSLSQLENNEFTAQKK